MIWTLRLVNHSNADVLVCHEIILIAVIDLLFGNARHPCILLTPIHVIEVKDHTLILPINQIGLTEALEVVVSMSTHL